MLSRDGRFQPAGAVVCEEFSEAVRPSAREQATEDGAEEVCVIGGAALFALALPRARRIYLTEVEASPAGDVCFPAFDESDWREVEPRGASRRAGTTSTPFVFRVLERAIAPNRRPGGWSWASRA